MPSPPRDAPQNRPLSAHIVISNGSAVHPIQEGSTPSEMPSSLLADYDDVHSEGSDAASNDSGAPPPRKRVRFADPPATATTSAADVSDGTPSLDETELVIALARFEDAVAAPTTARAGRADGGGDYDRHDGDGEDDLEIDEMAIVLAEEEEKRDATAMRDLRHRLAALRSAAREAVARRRQPAANG